MNDVPAGGRQPRPAAKAGSNPAPTNPAPSSTSPTSTASSGTAPSSAVPTQQAAAPSQDNLPVTDLRTPPARQVPAAPPAETGWKRGLAGSLAFVRRRMTGDYEVDVFG